MIKLNVINNEWYFTYDEKTRIIIKAPEFIAENKSVVLGDNIGLGCSKIEKELLDMITELGLIMPKEQ